jgi:hypothetical protein
MTGSMAVVVVVVVIIIVAMPVMMMVRLMCPAISTAFRRERLDHHFNICAQQLEHVFDHVISPHKYPACLDLRFQMPVSQVPGQYQHVVHVACADCHEFLGLRSHLEYAAVVQLEPVSVGQLHRLWQIQQEGHTFITGQANAAPMALVFRERNESVCRFVHVCNWNVL